MTNQVPTCLPLVFRSNSLLVAEMRCHFQAGNEVDDEGECHHPHHDRDLRPLALEDPDDDPADEAGTDAVDDRVGERHQHDDEERRNANREVRVKLYMGQVRNQPITIICIKQKF